MVMRDFVPESSIEASYVGGNAYVKPIKPAIAAKRIPIVMAKYLSNRSNTDYP